MTTDIIYKFCPKCKTSKKPDSFAKDVSSKVGLKTYCKQCNKQFRAERKLDIISLVAIVPNNLFFGQIQKTNYCWIWTGKTDKNGYGRFSYAANTVLSHRFVYAKTKGRLDAKIKVLHRCDNPPCCNPDHLFEGTQADNVRDMIQKQRHSKGSQRYNAKLNELQVKEIKGMLSNGKKQCQIANEFSVDASVISDIKRGVMWRHVT